MEKELKILSIGNSFSTDATRNLHAMAKAAGVSVKTVNLYIGGCSLETHVTNLRGDLAAYSHEVNGEPGDRMCSIREGLTEDTWDIVTLQQASGYSGLWDSYAPYLQELSDYVKQYAPQATQWIHNTWAYDSNSQHPHFVFYEGQDGMYRDLCACYRKAAEQLGIRRIPVGTVIQVLRANDPFRMEDGGLSLTRDGFHMSMSYGRYAAAATWLYTLTGKLPDDSYRPVDDPETTPENLALIRRVIKAVCV